MDNIRLIFCANNQTQDIVLRVGMMFKYSHVGIITPAGTAIHATFPFVREDGLEDFCQRFPKFEVRSYPVENAERGYKWLKQQVGKPYDLGAIFGFVFQRDWEDPKKWFCSELGAAFLAECGSPRFRVHDVKRVWPQTLYCVR